MDTQQPNIILICVDQLRFDTLGHHHHPVVSTPHLDMLASQGYHFSQMYTAVPSCIASRAALMTGLSQAHHGRVGYEDNVDWAYDQFMADSFRNAGYQTEAVGKLHVTPERKRIGFDHVMLHDGYLHEARKYTAPYGQNFEYADDYLMWLKEQLGHHADLMDDGIEPNSWVARPWMYGEQFHPTNWVVHEGIRFLQRRDPEKPFFLNLSFTRPHPPLNPPQYYFDMYMNKIDEFPVIEMGAWKDIEEPLPFSITAKKGHYHKDELDRMRAGYYGNITHIDHQIGRFLIALNEQRIAKNTIILFVSDHGDQLGEHNLFRKAYPYQGSIHIPMMIYDKGNLLKGKHRDLHQIGELRDIYPTLLDLANIDIPKNIDGVSLKPALYDDTFVTREYLHGEHSFGKDSNQFIMNDAWKYTWYPVRGIEQLFHYQDDPHEKHNLIHEAEYQAIKNELKQQLIKALTDREEGFVKKGELQILSETKPTLDHLQARNKSAQRQRQ
ncbi:TPA: arylsulfatase [Staphylococcus pseudintermedius]|uniref:arylsulfatase n=1 Tax=Staphylococcus pseudintermedius TaxID=283734 RepID=UPI00089DCFE2|nr:arylsulfatase [Staphylococcus pseudintermedius]EHT3674847.1 arylsulfatase [Staphylococcus pseudintermedius]EHV5272827.1 arylsulfatase [Staphylococcus pseudintermedius]EII6305648.1 arylsulfatase [Staphylococcus pseudintermedius]EIU0287765.1 arylsulfatase [Staphylococcus pseudintermedius]EJG1231272.1 arylsulfatase [Staphylococcus pseudintermedius]